MAETAYVPRLRAEYDRNIRGMLTEKFGYENVMQVPRLDKVVLNMGVGDSVNDRKKAETAAAELSQIAGQKAIVTYSRIAIATFKLRENQPIGCKVTLRKARMYEFIDRLVNVAAKRSSIGSFLSAMIAFNRSRLAAAFFTIRLRRLFFSTELFFAIRIS